MRHLHGLVIVSSVFSALTLLLPFIWMRDIPNGFPLAIAIFGGIAVYTGLTAIVLAIGEVAKEVGVTQHSSEKEPRHVTVG